MINYKQVQNIIKIQKETDWDYEIQKCWNNLISIFSENIAASIRFLETECTPEDIYWISEVFDDIALKTQSKEFIAALHRIRDKMPKDIQKSIDVDIEFAEQNID